MIEPPDEDERRRIAANYLHYEDSDPSMPEKYFDTFEEALDWVNERELTFASEDWEPFGLFELRIECLDEILSVAGQLRKLSIKLEPE